MGHEEIRLYASHYQFCIQDSDPPGDPGDPSFWNEKAVRDRVAIGKGLVAIGTGTYGIVKVRVEQHQSKPPLELDRWDHVTECPLVIRSTMLLVMGCVSSSGLFFMVTQGKYRVRACHANLKDSDQEAGKSKRRRFGDWYLVQFWPSESAGVRVLKRR